jgi:hypothetical protein
MAIHTCLVTYIYLLTNICPTKFSDVGFCPTKFKLCPTKIESDRTNVLSSQIFICSPAVDRDTKGTNKQLHVMHWQMNINSRRGKYEPERKYVRKTPFAQKNIL